MTRTAVRTMAAFAAVAAIAVAGGAWVASRRAPQSAPASGSPQTGASALFYGQTLSDASGVAHAMDANRGRVVVVNFWATWCVPCIQEIPAFSRVHADGAGRVAFVGLGIDSPDNIAAFNDRFKPSYPLYAAGAVGTDLARAFGDASGALPFTVVIDGSGRVVASHLGQVDEATLRRWLAPYAAS